MVSAWCRVNATWWPPSVLSRVRLRAVNAWVGSSPTVHWTLWTQGLCLSLSGPGTCQLGWGRAGGLTATLRVPATSTCTCRARSWTTVRETCVTVTGASVGDARPEVDASRVEARRGQAQWSPGTALLIALAVLRATHAAVRGPGSEASGTHARGSHRLWRVSLPHTSNSHRPAAPAPVEEPLISAAAHGLGVSDTHGAISDAMCIPNLAGGSPTVGDLLH